ncbi:sensor histidine kinase [Cellulosimicrobium sp. NPDC057862]|uniref:sensor histidine kinase n=1 Tax=Cellulosimicrobium sp. NPDC057862 TaxID=3346266 RepID=UPI00366BDB14
MGVQVSRADVLVAVSSGAAGALLVVLRGSSGLGWATVGVEVAAQLAASALLLARRRYPLAVLGACVVLSFVSPAVATLAALYTVGAEVRSARTSGAAVLGVVAATWPAWRATAEPSGPTTLWVATLMTLFAYVAGRAERSRAEADRRAAASAEEAARAGERARLARELHDVVSHRVSYAVVEAEVLATTTEDADVRRLADEIGASGRAALAEMRQVLTALTADAPEPARGTSGSTGGTSAGPAAIEALAEEARTAGQPVRVRVSSPSSSPPDLVDRTVARVVGEGLTNAVRHAPGAATTVDVSPVEDGVRVTVDNAPPTSPPTGLTTGGFGLAGLRERVELLGGTLESGPTPPGGYRLRATLPRRTP